MLLWALAILTAAGPEAADASERLARQVRPILARCVRCHGGDEPAGELDLTTRDAALRGGESGPALDATDAARSLLLRKVVARKMPPKEPLPAEQVALVRAWALAGAVWESSIRPDEAPPSPPATLWATRPIAAPNPPRVRRRDWARDPIDVFILARLEAEGLAPTPEADRLTLIRRATFDLTGLPPTPGPRPTRR